MPEFVPEGEVQKTLQPGKRDIKKRDTARKQKALNEASYNVIVQKDLFRPSRAEKKVENSPSEITPGVKPQLFGTIITENEKGAILEDPSTKTSKFYRLKDTVAGYTIEDIQEDKVLLSKGGSSIEVRLREGKAVKMPRRQSPSVRSRQRARKTQPSEKTPKRPARKRRRPASRPPSPDAELFERDSNLPDDSQGN